MARTIKLYRVSEDGRRVAAGAFQATSESDLQMKWELQRAPKRVAPHLVRGAERIAGVIAF